MKSPCFNYSELHETQLLPDKTQRDLVRQNDGAHAGLEGVYFPPRLFPQTIQILLVLICPLAIRLINFKNTVKEPERDETKYNPLQDDKSDTVSVKHHAQARLLPCCFISKTQHVKQISACSAFIAFYQAPVTKFYFSTVCFLANVYGLKEND
jgi:hypothetical protein